MLHEARVKKSFNDTRPLWARIAQPHWKDGANSSMAALLNLDEKRCRSGGQSTNSGDLVVAKAIP